MVVHRVRLIIDADKVPAGEILYIPNPQSEVHHTYYIPHALRKAGYKDDEWGSGVIGQSSSWGDWTVIAESSEAYHKLVQELEKYSKPIYSGASSQPSAPEKKTKESKSKSGGKGGYWSACKNMFGGLFWILSPILLVLWIPITIIKWIFKLLWAIIKLALGILTFGLISNWLNKQ
ncbi:MAG: hypothetical protein K2N05_12065 [Muribaculaceae bacterium]|nr:hypothetical protein [Muribaculaceae bacterium]